MADGAPSVSHPRFNGAAFCGKWTGRFRSSGGQIYKSVWDEHKLNLLRGVVGPTYTRDDYLNTVFDDR